MYFRVTDTGVGIPLDNQETIFEAFEQVDGSITRASGGTGLGLAIARQLVEMMEGAYGFQVARIREPLCTSQAVRVAGCQQAKQGISEATLDLTGIRVIVVDDNALNRRILRETLINWGMEPLEVDGGRAAIEAIAKANHEGRPFSLALIDFMMPEMDGCQLIDG